MKIDIIICTYNRPQKVVELVNQLMLYSSQFNSIIIVDSSDDVHPVLSNYNQLTYLRSSYKNQPYQRWLGYHHSKGDILIFLDDDMEVANGDFLNIIRAAFNEQMVSGIAINFVDKHTDTALAAIPRSVLLNKAGVLKNIVGWLTGYPVLPYGKFGLCGVKGKQPLNGGTTQWLSGGAFAAKRAFLFQNFNFQLFDLFQQKTGMGEDAIIGYGLSKQGILLYEPTLLFYHNDQKDSAYSVDHFAYAKRVIFSRLYLSLEKTRLNKGSYIFATIHYHWYVLWRVAGLVINYMIKKNATKNKILKGSVAGWKLALKFKFNKNAATIDKWQ